MYAEKDGGFVIRHILQMKFLKNLSLQVTASSNKYKQWSSVKLTENVPYRQGNILKYFGLSTTFKKN